MLLAERPSFLSGRPLLSLRSVRGRSNLPLQLSLLTEPLLLSAIFSGDLRELILTKKCSVDVSVESGASPADYTATHGDEEREEEPTAHHCQGEG